MGAVVRYRPSEERDDVATLWPHGVESQTLSQKYLDHFRKMKSEARKEFSRIHVAKNLEAQARGETYQRPPTPPGLGLGFEVPEECLAPVVKIVNGRRLLDYNELGSTVIPVVSQRFKDAVEQVEPGVHQFTPVEVLQKNGALATGGPYYYLAVRVTRNTIDTEASELTPIAVNEDISWPTTALSVHPGKHIALRLPEGEPAGLWYELRTGEYLYASAALLNALELAGAEGLDVDFPFEELLAGGAGRPGGGV